MVGRRCFLNSSVYRISRLCISNWDHESVAYFICGWREGQAGRQAGRQADRQPASQPASQTDTQIDRERESERERGRVSE